MIFEFLNTAKIWYLTFPMNNTGSIEQCGRCHSANTHRCVQQDSQCRRHCAEVPFAVPHHRIGQFVEFPRRQKMAGHQFGWECIDSGETIAIRGPFEQLLHNQTNHFPNRMPNLCSVWMLSATPTSIVRYTCMCRSRRRKALTSAISSNSWNRRHNDSAMRRSKVCTKRSIWPMCNWRGSMNGSAWNGCRHSHCPVWSRTRMCTGRQCLNGRRPTHWPLPSGMPKFWPKLWLHTFMGRREALVPPMATVPPNQARFSQRQR